ncbi:DNA-binding response regulator [Planomicrobium sp. Y74]|nr:DNA-binding response regulator [Planomicrobium sp. Y74]
MTNIVLIDSHPLFREGLRRVLETEETFKVVGEGDSSEKLIPLYKQHLPQLILMEINFLQKNNLNTLKELTVEFPDAKALIFTTATEFNFVDLALQNGASGYLLKEMDTVSLINALKEVLKGGFYLHPKIARTFISLFYEKSTQLGSKRSYHQTAVQRPYHLMTRREIEVLQLLSEGHNNKHLGEALFISEKTVKNHVSAILRKMDVVDRTQAVVKALKNGWIELK